MKLESTLKVRPDFLYLAPLLNVVGLLLLFFLLVHYMQIMMLLRKPSK
jgi:hypothetical protein